MASGCNYFIETGTNVGSTLAFVARTYSRIECFSSEPDKASFEEAVKNTSAYANAHVYNKLSQDFIEFLADEKKKLFNENVFFWLDAHGDGFEWPLKEEMKFITANFNKAFIFIDDFKVPGMDCFKYDEYEDQICSFEFIKESINNELKFSLFYPSYTVRTSTIHPLTGWGLIEYGHEETIEFPVNLRDKI